MKKKVFGILLAAVLIMAQTATVFAAGSKEAEGVQSSVEIGTTEEAYDAIDSADTLTDAQKTEVKDQLEKANAGDLSAIPNAPTGNVVAVTKVFDVKEAGTAKFKVTLPSNVSNVYALHFSVTRGEWETLPASVDADGWISVTLKDVSPIIIVAQTKSGSGSKSHKSSSSSTTDTSSADAASEDILSPQTDAASGDILSPQTGVASDWALWLSAAVVLLGIAGVAFRKTRA